MTTNYAEFVKQGHRLSYKEYKAIIVEARSVMDITGNVITPADLEKYKLSLNKKNSEICLAVVTSYFLSQDLERPGGLDDSKPIEIKKIGKINLDVYFNHITHQKSKLTVRGYKSDIKQFRKIIPKAFEAISVHDIDDYVLWLSQTYPEKNTRIRKLRAVKSMFDFMVSRDYLTEDLFRKISIGTPRAKVSKRVDDGLIDKLFDGIEFAPKTEKNLLIGALLGLLDSGARKKEILGLRKKDVDLQNAEFHVTLKGGRKASYPIPNENLGFIRDFMEYRNGKSGEFVFMYKGKLLVDRIMYNLLYSFQKKTIGQIIKPHAFRHHLIDILDENGASVKEIQEAGNWLSPQTALRYISKKQSKKTIQKYHPRG
jgi:site-specific recombinase XerD